MRLQHLRISWHHDDPRDPIALYSELDPRRHEVRKVEVFRDGRLGYACGAFEHGGSRIAKMAMPHVAEIAADPQFQPVEITAQEFEAMWLRAVRATSSAQLAYGP
jgi:hypothetical protein